MLIALTGASRNRDADAERENSGCWHSIVHAESTARPTLCGDSLRNALCARTGLDLCATETQTELRQ